MGIIKNYHDKKLTLQFLDTLYNSIDLRLKKALKFEQPDLQCTNSSL
jgi:hypothetical protein